MTLKLNFIEVIIFCFLLVLDPLSWGLKFKQVYKLSENAYLAKGNSSDFGGFALLFSWNFDSQHIPTLSKGELKWKLKLWTH